MPSEWAERKRYLPPQTTPFPGFYRFELVPYLREIVDCLSVEDPTREITVMKGVQLGFTVGVLENALGYFIEHVKTAPIMLVTADAELAKLRMESYVTPMLQYSGLDRLITSSDVGNSRKTGKTDKKIEWEGGGFLVPTGAQNANKLRSLSVQVLLRDEVDGWPGKIGKDGDPIKLSADRTSAYESSRKILDISTPLIKRQSKIEQRFLRGDQRRYFVRCLACNWAQVLRWRRVHKETGEVSGIVWDTEDGRLVPDSVRYLCEKCGHAHFEENKIQLLAPEYGAEWRPTAEAQVPHHRSYHINALYSPVGMQSWAACVQAWMEAWDDERNRMRDVNKLQVFYNGQLGEPFEARGERVRFNAVSQHRRDYHFGDIPNKASAEWCASSILVLTCSVDVHQDALHVSVFGWARERRCFLISYERLDGDPTQLDDKATWGALADMLEHREFRSDDGKLYRIALTLIDSGYLTDQVYRFAAQFELGVYPVKGRDIPPKTASLKEFQEFTTPNGVRAFWITVDLYKDRWAAALRREWSGQELQPPGHFNAPADVTDAQLKELTVEFKVPKAEDGFEWHRPSGAANELWDGLIYSTAGFEILAWHWCRNDPEGPKLEATNWPEFYAHCEAHQPYFRPSE